MVMTGLKSSSNISGDNQASPLTGAIWQNESTFERHSRWWTISATLDRGEVVGNDSADEMLLRNTVSIRTGDAVGPSRSRQLIEGRTLGVCNRSQGRHRTIEY